jgi:peptidoglycan/LPS O-acetylase OafA/YrhL
VIEQTETGWPGSPAGLVLRVVTEFCLGALLRVLAGAAAAQLRRFRRAALLAGWSAAASLAWSSHSGLFLAAMIWTMLFLSLDSGWSGRLGAVSRYLGESSYAVYMCHALVLTVWAGLASRTNLGLLGAPPAAALLLCLSIQGCASLLHHMVERPARTAVRGWARQRLRPVLADGQRAASALSSAPGSCASLSPSTSTT